MTVAEKFINPTCCYEKQVNDMAEAGGARIAVKPSSPVKNQPLYYDPTKAQFEQMKRYRKELEREAIERKRLQDFVSAVRTIPEVDYYPSDEWRKMQQKQQHQQQQPQDCDRGDVTSAMPSAPSSSSSLSSLHLSAMHNAHGDGEDDAAQQQQLMSSGVMVTMSDASQSQLQPSTSSSQCVVRRKKGEKARLKEVLRAARRGDRDILYEHFVIGTEPS